MATKPAAWQEQELVNESWARGEVGAMISPDSCLQDKKAPRAEPEEDIDGPDAPVETADASAVENQEPTRISLYSPGASQKMGTKLEVEVEEISQQSGASQTQDQSEESPGLCQDASPPPPPPLRALSTEERLARERLSSLEAEVDEWMSDGEIISDLMSPDSQISHEWPQTPPPTETFDRCAHSPPEEMTGDKTMTEKDITQTNFLPDGNNSEPENDMSPARVNHSPMDRNTSDDDVYTVRSPPFVDESEEEEDRSGTITPCQQQCSEPDIKTSISASTDHLPAVPADKQQKELLDQSRCELAPRGMNQEAAQQVLSQDSPPLSTVAMEPSNQGVEASKASGCNVAVREMHNRAGERTEGESKRVGGWEGQKECARERYKTVGLQRGTGVSTVHTQEIKIQRHRFVFSKHRRMESDSSDDSHSDSGVPADFSPRSTLEVTTVISPAPPGAESLETPIEREIRRSIEREHSLRRARGLPNQSTMPEYVEIPLRKTVLQQSLVANTEKFQGKDRVLAGKKMQQEIHVEVQREQDLVKLGKIPGFYDKGTVRQLKERKELFEAFQQASDSTLIVPNAGKAKSWSYAGNISTLDNDDTSSQSSSQGGSYAESSSSSSSSSSSGSRGSEKGKSSASASAPGRRFSEVIIRENNLSVPAQNLHHSKTKIESFTTVDGREPYISSSTSGWISEHELEEEEDAEMTAKENPFFKLRTSTNLVKVEQDIREARQREKELHKQRLSLYGGMVSAKREGGRGGGRPASIDGKSSTYYSYSLNGLPVPDSPGSVSRKVTGPPAARQSVGKIGAWTPAQGEEKISRPEVQHSPRTPRHKNPMVQRWESGLVNGHNEGEH